MAPNDTRLRILDVAARLFHEQGYAATGVATILREAEVRSGSLYYFFQSKERVLQGVLERYLERLEPEIMAPVAAAIDDPIERVFELLGRYRQFLEESGCTRGCPVGNLALELADDHPEIRGLIDRNFDNWIGVVTLWLEQAGDRLPEEAHRRDLAVFVLTVMQGGLMQSRAAGSTRPFEQGADQLRAYFDLLQARANQQRIDS